MLLQTAQEVLGLNISPAPHLKADIREATFMVGLALLPPPADIKAAMGWTDEMIRGRRYGEAREGACNFPRRLPH